MLPWSSGSLKSYWICVILLCVLVYHRDAVNSVTLGCCKIGFRASDCITSTFSLTVLVMSSCLSFWFVEDGEQIWQQRGLGGDLHHLHQHNCEQREKADQCPAPVSPQRWITAAWQQATMSIAKMLIAYHRIPIAWHDEFVDLFFLDKWQRFSTFISMPLNKVQPKNNYMNLKKWSKKGMDCMTCVWGVLGVFGVWLMSILWAFGMCLVCVWCVWHMFDGFPVFDVCLISILVCI